MYLLDTDVTSNLLDTRRTSRALRDRLRAHPLDELAISIVTVEEIMRGTLDSLRRAQMRKRNIVEAYEELRVLYNQLYRFSVLPFSAEAEIIFQSLPAAARRIGVNDCRIASIALAHGCTLVSANLRDFQRIPGLLVEDWTVG